MERSAVYRRALAPIMLSVGTVGLAAAILGITLHLDSFALFGCLWLSTAIVAVLGAFFIARRQAVQTGEPFWSPPTRRVAQALAPAFAASLVINLLLLTFNVGGLEPLFVLVNVFFYGCAIHAAGFFMPRGIKIFGWLIIGLGSAILLALCLLGEHVPLTPALNHALMGFFFGVLHLAYGAYLYLTENRKNAA